MGMLQDPADEHWVLGDALGHQQDALLYSMPLQHSQAGHFLQGQRQGSGPEWARGKGHVENAELGSLRSGASPNLAIDLMLAQVSASGK